MLYREHRGLLAESMETVKEFQTLDELKEHIKLEWCGYDVVTSIEFQHVGFDVRINWDTYNVIGKFKNYGETIIGMSNGILE